RIVIASVDTYLRFAEATNRLDLYSKNGKDLPELMEGMTESGAKGKTSGMLGAAKDALTSSSDEDEDEDEERRRQRRPAKKSSSSEGRTRRRQRET
ncbi:MAG TPA: gas vesicle protein, partial [Nocardioidaceae bacterium]